MENLFSESAISNYFITFLNTFVILLVHILIGSSEQQMKCVSKIN